MFFAPLLNAFVEEKGRKILKWVLAFCLIEFWFECVQHVETLGFKQGYSFLHFVLVYMIGRCVFLYIRELHMLRMSWWVYGYLLCVVVESFMYLFRIGRDWEYCNPLVILSTICLFLPFTYYSFCNKYINSIAISTLSVYVMQCFNPVYRILITLDTKMLHSLTYFHYLLLSVIVWIVFFMSCIAYDKIRLMVTVPMLRYFYKRFKV